MGDSVGVETGTPGQTGRGLMWSRTFALTFTSKLNETFTTIPIVMPASDSVQNMRNFFLDVEHALEALPNGVIDNVKVNGDMRISTWQDGAVRPWQKDSSAGDANMEISDQSGVEIGNQALDGGQQDRD